MSMRHTLGFLLGLCVLPTLASTTLEDVTASLAKDIKRSTNALTDEQKHIQQAQRALVDKVHKQVQAISTLRERAANAARQRDEQLLSLQQLRDRLQNWQSQAAYQHQILQDLHPVLSKDAQPDKEVDRSDAHSLKRLLAYLEAQQKQTVPSVNTRQVALETGEIVDAKTLSIGPVSWFYYPAQARSGLLNTRKAIPEAEIVFEGQTHDELARLITTGSGRVTFDPTLDKLMMQDTRRESTISHIKKGGVWALPIIGFAMTALIIGLVKAIALAKLPRLMPLFAERLTLLEQRGVNQSQIAELKERAREAQRSLLEITMHHGVSQRRDDELFAYLLNYRHRLERGIGTIALIASVSPLLGLLGTVSGMIETFRMMTLFGAGDPAIVSGGISEALVTTELGLIVAIPALIVHALLNRHVKTRCLSLEAQATQLSQITIHPSFSTTDEQAA